MLRRKTFISYQHEDYETAAAICEALQHKGVSVWWDKELQTGQKWSIEIDRALMSASSVIVLWSRRSAISEWVTHEASIAKIRNVLTHVSIDGTAPPEIYRSIQYIEACNEGSEIDGGELSLIIKGIKIVEKENRLSEYRKISVWCFSFFFLGVLTLEVGRRVERSIQPAELTLVTSYEMRKDLIAIQLDNSRIREKFASREDLLFICQNFGSDHVTKFRDSDQNGNLLARASVSDANTHDYIIDVPAAFGSTHGSMIRCAITLAEENGEELNDLMTLSLSEDGFLKGEMIDGVSLDQLEDELNLIRIGKKGDDVCDCLDWRDEDSDP